MASWINPWPIPIPVSKKKLPSLNAVVWGYNSSEQDRSPCVRFHQGPFGRRGYAAHLLNLSRTILKLLPDLLCDATVTRQAWGNVLLRNMIDQLRAGSGTITLFWPFSQSQHKHSTDNRFAGNAHVHPKLFISVVNTLAIVEVVRL